MVQRAGWQSCCCCSQLEAGCGGVQTDCWARRPAETDLSGSFRPGWEDITLDKWWWARAGSHRGVSGLRGSHACLLADRTDACDNASIVSLLWSFVIAQKRYQWPFLFGKGTSHHSFSVPGILSDTCTHYEPVQQQRTGDQWSAGLLLWWPGCFIY